MPINFVSVINKSKSLNYLFHQTNYAGALRCDNQYRGTLNFNNHTYTQNRSPINRSIQKNNCLIVIGESPHISEYNFLTKPITVNGPMFSYDSKISGLLSGQLKTISGAIPTSGIWDIYLVNAIPYQCSFGMKLRGKGKNYSKQKNNVFSIAWNTEPCLIELIKELKTICCNLDDDKIIILNACTNTLKSCCNTEALKTLLSLNSIYDEKHISTW
ncbi:MAG: hypothetical protein SPK49_04905 [Erysipelotrichaceae bacterium]|nr:hypothetical protein [Erysipelotrichaceae bacterium]